MPDATWYLLAGNRFRTTACSTCSAPSCRMISRGPRRSRHRQQHVGESAQAAGAAYSRAKAGVTGLRTKASWRRGPSGIPRQPRHAGGHPHARECRIGRRFGERCGRNPLGAVGEPEECAEAINVSGIGESVVYYRASAGCQRRIDYSVKREGSCAGVPLFSPHCSFVFIATAKNPQQPPPLDEPRTRHPPRRRSSISRNHLPVQQHIHRR